MAMATTPSRGETEVEIICSICLDPLFEDVDNKRTVLTKCGHMFHESCLKDWFLAPLTRGDKTKLSSGSCPKCNAKIFMTACIRVFPTTQTRLTQPIEMLREEFDNLHLQHLDLQRDLAELRARTELWKSPRSTKPPGERKAPKPPGEKKTPKPKTNPPKASSATSTTAACKPKSGGRRYREFEANCNRA